MPAPRRREGEPLARQVRSWSTSESVGVEAPSVRFEADRGGGVSARSEFWKLRLARIASPSTSPPTPLRMERR